MITIRVECLSVPIAYSYANLNAADSRQMMDTIQTSVQIPRRPVAILQVITHCERRQTRSLARLVTANNERRPSEYKIKKHSA